LHFRNQFHANRITYSPKFKKEGKTLKLYEQNDNTLLLERSLAVDMPAVQTFTYSFSDKEPGIYSYVAVTSDGTGSLNSNIITVTVEEEDGGDDEEEDPELVNAAAGRPITASDYIWGNASYVTDGDKNTNNYMGVTQNLQWIQIDLGESKKIHQINLWHYYGDGRTYHDVIVRLSDTPDFSGGVTTVFNNDNDNSAGFGAGSDDEYAETSEGKTIVFAPVRQDMSDCIQTAAMRISTTIMWKWKYIPPTDHTPDQVAEI